MWYICKYTVVDLIQNVDAFGVLGSSKSQVSRMGDFNEKNIDSLYNFYCPSHKCCYLGNLKHSTYQL
jgi:uncharacterized protein YmfQ (DUF2313 family)